MPMLPNDGSKRLETRPLRLFSIHVPEAVWIVECGNLDLFTVRAENGEPAGARQHFLRVEQGGAIFGLGPSGGSEIIIVAAATPGTRVLELSRTGLLALAQVPGSGSNPDPLVLLEDWISKPGAAAASVTARPNSFPNLESGAILEVSDEPKPIMPVSGILWVEHLQGVSRFLDSAEIEPVDGRRRFPVSRNGWLQPAPRSRIFSMDSQEWQRGDPEWRSLQSFHNVILERLVLNRQISEDKARGRLLVQSASDRAIVRAALRSLASPLEDRSAHAPAGNAGFADPTLLASEAVGKSLGVTIVAPAEKRSGTPAKDPVASIARASELRHRVVVLKRKWWLDANGPLLAFRDVDNRPMALLPGPKRGYQLFDPVEQTTIPVTGAVALTLKGFAYMFYRPLPARKLSIWDLLSFGM